MAFLSLTPKAKTGKEKTDGVDYRKTNSSKNAIINIKRQMINLEKCI